jgi:uncharacterized protein DUF5679
MAKAAKGEATGTRSGRDAQRQVRRLERRLAAIRELESKRRRQAAEARDRSGARSLQAKRQRQLDKAHRRSEVLEAELATLTTSPAPAAAADVPYAYCLREKQRVQIAQPTAIVMRNGRPGVAGTCPGCGARLVRPR